MRLFFRGVCPYYHGFFILLSLPNVWGCTRACAHVPQGVCTESEAKTRMDENIFLREFARKGKPITVFYIYV
jgi:hypothetical protein